MITMPISKNETVVELSWFMRDVACGKLGMTDFENIIVAMVEKKYIDLENVTKLMKEEQEK